MPNFVLIGLGSSVLTLSIFPFFVGFAGHTLPLITLLGLPLYSDYSFVHINFQYYPE